ncbi:serine hydrolase domain-containing protein [Pseudonocardia acaciae]|uniref:serine hydrolase domain-containing protein n=1 Tax=Pseudonocardia acaciae TaxID=551276 RepID=UPI00048A6712|nr:serine hydrolase domain-containing protein [Pseudonocardia acaciae]
MAGLEDLLRVYVDDGSFPGAVAVVASAAGVEWAAVGFADADHTAPMARDSIFRIASITKPITAAAVLMLVDDGRIGLDEPIGGWLPELAEPVVARTPAGPAGDVVPAERPITVFDLLTNQAGWGFPSDFSLPAAQPLFAVQKDGREVAGFPPPDEWIAQLSRVPLLYQPGQSWLYDTCSTVQGVLVERVTGRSLPDVLAERVFAPLGMTDTAFAVPAGKLGRFTSLYKTQPAGELKLMDTPDGQWSTMPAFPMGSGGLAGTAGDWLAFARMLLAGGVTDEGRRLLSADAVRLMTTDHTTAAHRKIGELFLEGQGWGMGGTVDIAATEPWNVPGRYGWVGGTGTSAHVIPATGAVGILLTQAGSDSPVPARWMRDFWRYTAGV